jgi:gluconokinase
MEAVCLRIGQIYQLLRQALPADPQVLASGGAMESSPTWVQILADVLGQQVTLVQDDQATARGTAILAAHSLGLISSLDQAGKAGRDFIPDAKNHELYQAAARRQQEFYQKMVVEGLGADKTQPGS